jgi:hypothetical protein
MTAEPDVGRSPSGRATHERSRVAPSPPSRVSVPNAVLDEVAFAIERARCPGREGPYGGYDYGHNTEFYGPEPEGGRYVVRDFRDFGSETWGAWVHQTHDEDEHEQALLRLTGRHIAEAAIRAYAQAIEARRAETAKTGSVEDESAVAASDAPKGPNSTIGEQIG